MKTDVFWICFFLGASVVNSIDSSRLTEIVFLVWIIGCSIDTIFDESTGVISANPIGKLDVANNKIAIKDRRVLN